MKNKYFLIGGILIAAAIGYTLYKKNKDKSKVDEAKDKILASVPSTATPGIVATTLVAEEATVVNEEM